MVSEILINNLTGSKQYKALALTDPARRGVPRDNCNNASGFT